MKVHISETHLRDLIRGELIHEAEEKRATDALNNGDIKAVLGSAEAMAKKIAGMDKDSALKYLRSGATKKLSLELASALADAGVDKMTSEIQKGLMSAMQRDMSDEAAKAEFELGEAEERRYVGDEWIDTANDLGNLVDMVVNGAGLVLMLPFLIVFGVGQEVARAVKKVRQLPNRDWDIMRAVHNATVVEDPAKFIAWVEENRAEIDELYKKYSGWTSKVKKDQESISRFTSAYDQLFGGQKALGEAVTDLVVLDDAPTTDVARSTRDPHADIAAWDVIRDPDFYEGIGPDDLETALEGLYLMQKNPPEYADRGEIQAMIDHVEGLLGYELGEETIDIPWG